MAGGGRRVPPWRGGEVREGDETRGRLIRLLAKTSKKGKKNPGMPSAIKGRLRSCAIKKRGSVFRMPERRQKKGSSPKGEKTGSYGKKKGGVKTLEEG